MVGFCVNINSVRNPHMEETIYESGQFGMIKFYRTDHKVLSEITEYEDNMWVCMTKPTVDETKLIAEDFEMPEERRTQNRKIGFVVC